VRQMQSVQVLVGMQQQAYGKQCVRHAMVQLLAKKEKEKTAYEAVAEPSGYACAFLL